VVLKFYIRNFMNYEPPLTVEIDNTQQKTDDQR
jgi:hypothetical protein